MNVKKRINIEPVADKRAEDGRQRANNRIFIVPLGSGCTWSKVARHARACVVGRALAFSGGSACGEARLVMKKSHEPKEQKEQKVKQEEQKRTRREGRTRVYRALGVPCTVYPHIIERNRIDRNRNRNREKKKERHRYRKKEKDGKKQRARLSKPRTREVFASPANRDTHRSPIPKSAGRLSCLRTLELFGCSYFVNIIYISPAFSKLAGFAVCSQLLTRCFSNRLRLVHFSRSRADVVRWSSILKSQPKDKQMNK